jgi:hypothetical protein
MVLSRAAPVNEPAGWRGAHASDLHRVMLPAGPAPRALLASRTFDRDDSTTEEATDSAHSAPNVA